MINTFLEKYSCYITQNEIGYYIKADNEVQFRVMMAEYINTSSDRLKEFTNEVFPKVMYSKFENVFEYDLSKGYMMTLERFSDMRVSQGFSVNDTLEEESSEFEYIINYFIKVMEQYETQFTYISKRVSDFAVKKLNLSDEIVVQKVIEQFNSTILRHVISGYLYYLDTDRLSIFCHNFEKRYKDISHAIDLEIKDILNDKFDINVERFIDEIKFFTYINIPEVIKPEARTVYILSDLGKEHSNTLKLVYKTMFKAHNFISLNYNELSHIRENKDLSIAGIVSNYEINSQSLK